MWKLSDDDVIAQCLDELAYLNIVDRREVQAAYVVRETESYPTYYLGFRGPFETLKKRTGEIENLHAIGRGGMYRYNNQDHAMLSGVLAARNELGLPGSPYDLWSINTEKHYLESAPANRVGAGA